MCLRAVGFRFKPDRGTRKRTTGLEVLEAWEGFQVPRWFSFALGNFNLNIPLYSEDFVYEYA